MSIQSVKSAIIEFLASKTPEVLCIRGHWGTGKTHNWKTIARDRRDKPGGVALNEYAYVSLFGLNTIGEIKIQILQNTVPRAQIGDLASFATLNNAVSTLERGAKKTVMQSIQGFFGNRADTIVSALGLLTSGQIICIDDLERKGPKLGSDEVLGFISYLKYERNCKIALLLNDEALQGEDKNRFAAYLEKVVDRNLLFAPTPEESASIAIEDQDRLSLLVRDRCSELGIDNIRVIHKINSAVKQIEPLLSAYKPDVLNDVATSIVLFGWMHHQPEIAPTLEFLKRHSRLSISDNNNELTPQEFRWATRLDEYGFTHVDDLDLALMSGISDGYFTQERIDAHAVDLHNRVLQREAGARYRAAWAKLHYSFAGGEEVVNNIAQSFKDEAAYLTAESLNNVVTLLRSFSMDSKTEDVIDAYIAAKSGVKDAFDTSHIFLRDEKLDEEVEKRLDEAQNRRSQPRHIDQVFLQLGEDGFSAETLTTLSSAPVDEYVRVFKAHEGEQLRTVLAGVFQYRGIENASEPMREIVSKAQEALTAIGKESRINAHRVKGWGVTIPNENIAADDACGLTAASQGQSPAAVIEVT
ncbi:hypothetical protein AMK06_CH02292 [Rhizobium sp. N541]|uniref:hypothetical protein n=1 Tax=unclassified Rhizobium TaxID=2613769 RepID=UPI0007EE6DBB|nr:MULTISPECIES: hypothetical protein [unclassified Rhizobium]ANM17186.1 hypothetical protein AMK06_CH02292 [Rhizobium sp. N541]